jgi:hypothetical protein
MENELLKVLQEWWIKENGGRGECSYDISDKS